MNPESNSLLTDLESVPLTDATIELPAWATSDPWNVNDLLSIGYFSAEYFNRTKRILDGRNKRVVMQVFQKHDAVVCGTLEAAGMIRKSLLGTDVDIYVLPDGERVRPRVPVMYIVGDLSTFTIYESMILGILADGTTVATNMANCVAAANGKPVYYLADRFNNFLSQEQQGYAALLGGAAAVCTPAMGYRLRKAAAGTMPHALIAAFDGDTTAATLAFADEYPEQNVVSLVDFHNDCVKTSLEVAHVLGSRLYAVRLDTSEKLVDVSVEEAMKTMHPMRFQGLNGGSMKANGVCPLLVRNVRDALDAAGHTHVKIVVSGGFNAEKIQWFEDEHVPVDIYGVGSSCLKNGSDFTADVVAPVSKVGRSFQFNPNVKRVV